MKQYIKKYFTLSLLFFVFTFCCNISYVYAGFDMGELSQDDIMAMQQALENEINNMSPEQRENFYQIMENVERMSQEDPAMLERFITGQMSKEEESQFVNAMVPESMAQQAAPQETIEPEDNASLKEESVKVETKEFSEKQASLQDVISAIIVKSESFLVKMQSYPEINSKIKNWSKDNSVMSLPIDKQWKDIEFDINIFVQKLLSIEHEKMYAKKKAFIDSILQNNSLEASLKNINNVLASYEKIVDIAPFGITKIQSETKDAMQKIIIVFIDELYNNQINNALDDVLKSYESEDKKLKEGEIEQTKKAQQESGKIRQKEYMKSAGQEKGSSYSGRSSYSGNYDDYDYGSYNDYGDYDNYSGYNNYSSSSYQPSSKNSYGSSSSYPSSSSGYVPSKKSSFSDSIDVEGSDKHSHTKNAYSKNKTEQPTKKIQTQKDQSQSKKKKDDKDKLVDTIEKYLEKVVQLLAKEDDYKKLSDVFDNVATTLQKEFTDEEQALFNEKLSNAVRYLTGTSKSALQSLRTLIIKLNKSPQTVKDEYKKQVEANYKEYKDIFEKFIQKMQVIKNAWNDLNISNKNAHYLWDNNIEIQKSESSKLDENDIKVEALKTTTLNDLKNALEELDVAINKFIK